MSSHSPSRSGASEAHDGRFLPDLDGLVGPADPAIPFGRTFALLGVAVLASIPWIFVGALVAGWMGV